MTLTETFTVTFLLTQVDHKITLLTNVFSINAQLKFTCSKSTTKTLEKGMKHVQVNHPFPIRQHKVEEKFRVFTIVDKNTKTMSLTWFWCLYRRLWTCFTLFSRVTVVGFEQVNGSWVCQFATFWQIVSKILVRKVLS